LDAGGRRRTDAADALWRGAGPVTGENRLAPLQDLSRRLPARPVIAPEARAVRVPSAATSRARMADALIPSARPRPPMPPVPPPVAPRTSAAPFAAVPTPEREPLRSSATALDERPAAPSALRDIPMPAGPAMLSQPVPELASRPESDRADAGHLAPWQTGRGEIRAERSPAGRPEGLPFVERRASRLSAGSQSSAGQAEMPAYGDWTKPSGPGRVPSAPVPPMPAMPPVPRAPMTTAIPDRDVAARADAADLDDRHLDDRHLDDRHDVDRQDVDDAPRSAVDDLRGPATPPPGHVTGTVVGGRAALRAERESREAARVAAEAARRKSAGMEDLEEPRRPRRLLMGLVAVGVVAAAVLGVYTVATPDTTETSTSAPSSPTSEKATAPTDAAGVTETLAPLDVDPPVAEPTVAAAPVRVPVTVLNSTEIQGLAADISEVIGAKDWETEKPGGYPGGDVAADTVFYTKGDDQQRIAAEQLIEQFPQLQGPAERFFEVPDEVAAPGLVVVLAGDWKP
jgi:hypothetical protein